ncbi:MAG TPA: apolipoprotein N-acyltransferase [Azospirillaceae bacterium]|nr:apolipoprotein N-acyltransferase [Azospirillaceae bacterium]
MADTEVREPRSLPDASGRRPWPRFAKAGLPLGKAFGLGALAVLALPPAYIVPVLFAAFPGLLLLLERAERPRRAFAIGWWFGFGYFLIGLYWVSFALFTDIAKFWWMVPFAVTGLPALLAVFTGLTTLAFHLLSRRLSLDRGLARPILFAMLWTMFELARGYVLTGFPWNLIGYVWVGVPPVLQAASLVGAYGLSLVTALVAALPVTLFDPHLPRRHAIAATLTGFFIITATAVWGTARLAGADGATVPGITLRLVQPAIDQKLKWDPREREANFQRHLDLSATPGGAPVTHVIWAETAVPPLPTFLEADIGRRLAIAAVTPPDGLTITGTPRATRGTDGIVRYWNSLVAVDGSGNITGAYDKFHLVPFGEYMPLRGWLPIDPIAAGSVDFSAGPGPATLRLPGLPPVSPLICYEGIFPGNVTGAGERPQWLLSLTNDAWYGSTAGPHQHFAITRMRAVEEGLPLVRVANTGISGVVDPYGRVTAFLPLGERGTVDSLLPAALDQPTPYGRWGASMVVVMLMSCSLIVILARQTR